MEKQTDRERTPEQSNIRETPITIEELAQQLVDAQNETARLSQALVFGQQDPSQSAETLADLTSQLKLAKFNELFVEILCRKAELDRLMAIFNESPGRKTLEAFM